MKVCSKRTFLRMKDDYEKTDNTYISRQKTTNTS